jgi:hypothetical protein
MKRGFGYRLAARHGQERTVNQMLAAEQAKRDAAAAAIETKAVRANDSRTLAELYGAPFGYDIDLWRTEEHKRAAADPNSLQTLASQRRAAFVADQFELSPEIERIYALLLRLCELPVKRLTFVGLVDCNTRERFNMPVPTTPGGIPPGFAHLHLNAVDAHLVLGLEPPGLDEMVSLTYSPLSRPSKALSPQQRLQAARVMQRATDALEALDFLRFVQRPNWALLRP